MYPRGVTNALSGESEGRGYVRVRGALRKHTRSWVGSVSERGPAWPEFFVCFEELLL